MKKLLDVENKFCELEMMLSDPEILADVVRWQKYNKEHANLAPIVEKFRELKKIEQDISDSEEFLNEPMENEMHQFIVNELNLAKEKKKNLEKELAILLLPKDANDEKNVIVEIRGGVGGEEASLFAGDLFRMYARYAEKNGWKVSILNSNPTELGGFKEISFAIEGFGAFSRMKYESGTHRVQRVPTTEASGRIHTSAATVAVLPEVDDVDLKILPEEIKIDTYCASGAGGQYVNRTESAVRITHLPTGIVVQCQNEKSQRKNKEQAMKVLRSRVLEKMQSEQQQQVAANRRDQVGSGDRSERIRTYNFPQGRVTDHRIGLTLHKLDDILQGNLDELFQALLTADQAERLKQIEE